MKQENQKKKDRYAQDVDKWMKTAQEKKNEYRLDMKNLDQLMDDNFHYNLKNGFELLGYSYHGDLSATKSIMLKCAQCMSSNKSEGKEPPCHSGCEFYDFMGEERYELTD